VNNPNPAPKRRDSGSGENTKVDRIDTQNFLRRTASALVLAPLAILAAYLGGWIFAAVCAATAMLVLWEWSALTRSDNRLILGAGLPALLAAAVSAQVGAPGVAILVIAAGAFIAAILMAARPRPDQPANAAEWAAAGIVYAAIMLVSPIQLRQDPQMGFAALLFLFATVWSTDIFAYLVGRKIGGPLLWPRLSPKKTWAGVVGGLAGGVVAGSIVAYASAGTHLAIGGVLALILSIAAQVGDLLESAVKRRFGVKDASALIPGHGGVMDRVDGLLVAALVAVLIGALRFDTATPAGGLLLW
jgi:phosphatidate cytidylyltransferase